MLYFDLQPANQRPAWGWDHGNPTEPAGFPWEWTHGIETDVAGLPSD